MKKYEKNLESVRKKKTKEEKHPSCISEPVPGPNHLICALCKE
jgi:ribosomal protein RSM22 (predicted rRNA methylase)